MTFSPNACVIGVIQPDNTVKLVPMQYTLGVLSEIEKDDRAYLTVSLLSVTLFANQDQPNWDQSRRF
jgi:hypothetical protein